MMLALGIIIGFLVGVLLMIIVGFGLGKMMQQKKPNEPLK